MDVASVRGIVNDLESGVGVVDVVHHLLYGGAGVEAVAPGESGVGLGVADDEEGLVAAFADPIEDFGVCDCGVNGVYWRIGIVVRIGGGCRLCEGEHAAGADLYDVAVLDGFHVVWVLCPGIVMQVAPSRSRRTYKLAVVVEDVIHVIGALRREECVGEA